MCRFRGIALVCAALALAAASDVHAQRGEKIRPGPWNQRSKIPAGWVVLNTRHYHVQSQAGEEKAQRLADHMEAMLRVYKKRFRSDKSSFKRYTIKLFKNRRAFIDYGASKSAAAFYSRVRKEMVCYDTGEWMDQEPEKRRGLLAFLLGNPMDVLGIAAHEGWHQYFHWYVTSWVEIPSWIDEGMGDYFYAARPIRAGGKKKSVTQLGRINDKRLPYIAAAIRQNRHFPLEKLLRMSRTDFYARSQICYPQAWSLCHFLLHSGNRKYGQVIPKFIRLVRDDTNMEKITKIAFRGIDLEKLQAEWKDWVLQTAKKT